MAPTAVEELLRWDSPVQLNMRAALEPAELAGEPIEPATGSSCSRARPTTTRGTSTARDAGPRPTPNIPLSFGWGIHHCLGAGLARMEGEIAFNALLARFGSIELATDEPEWRASFTLRGLLSLLELSAA